MYWNSEVRILICLQSNSWLMTEEIELYIKIDLILEFIYIMSIGKYFLKE
jgi:hypothetical protein